MRLHLKPSEATNGRVGKRSSSSWGIQLELSIGRCVWIPSLSWRWMDQCYKSFQESSLPQMQVLSKPSWAGVKPIAYGNDRSSHKHEVGGSSWITRRLANDLKAVNIAQGSVDLASVKKHRKDLESVKWWHVRIIKTWASWISCLIVLNNYLQNY